MRADWDVVVVGAGPAGAVAARALALRGLSVLLAERKAFPREKVCGGCLNAHAVAALEGAGLGPALNALGSPPLQALHLSAGRRSVRLPLSGGATVHRARLDQALVEAAIAAGAQFAPEHQVLPGAVERDLRRLTLRTGGRERQTSAAVVVAADGLGGSMLGGDLRPERGSRLGAGALLQCAGGSHEPGIVHVSIARGGYLGLAYLGDGRLNVAAAFDPEFVRAAGGLGEAAQGVLVSSGRPPLPLLATALWRGTPALTRRPRSPAAERLFAVGDASGYVEPFTGEGMASALADALAVAPLAEEAAGRWNDTLAQTWKRRHRERTRTARWRCSLIAALLRRPLLCSGLLRLLDARPRLGLSLAARIHGVEAKS